MLLGAIESGGTKFICATLDENLNILEKVSIKTRTPQETMTDVFNFFDKKNIDAFGIGSFGPIGTDKSKDDYGYITSTPKLAWKNYNFLGTMKERYHKPCGWTSDVSASCLGEAILGNGKGKNTTLYLTIGTGIGGGVVQNGEILNTWNTPEMGHIYVRRLENDTFKGSCPYHGDCLEGLISGPALEKRNNKKAQFLNPDDETWDKFAYYLAQALWTYTLTLVPDVIILGGGVMHQEFLFEKTRKIFKEISGNYVNYPNLDDFIVGAKLNDDQAIIGCGILAKREL